MIRRLSPYGLQTKSQGELIARSSARHWKQVTAGFKWVIVARTIPALVLLICMMSFVHRMRDQMRMSINQISMIRSLSLWSSEDSAGWRASCAPRTPDWYPPSETNGFLVVRCNGGVNQQRTAVGILRPPPVTICNAVLAARVMNATLVLPRFSTNSFWHDESSYGRKFVNTLRVVPESFIPIMDFLPGDFSGIYDVEHFIESLKKDVRIIQTLPTAWTDGKRRLKLKPLQLNPPRDAPVSWYQTTALEEMKQHGAIHLTPFAHRLDETFDSHEYQRLRCRVNYHALRFNDNIRNLSRSIIQRLRSGGPYVAVHLRFELDMLAYTGCLDIFTPEEQVILKKYRKENFAEKNHRSSPGHSSGKCPMTPHEVGLFLQAVGFDSSTRIYLAVGEIFGGERYLSPLRDLFPRLETRPLLAPPDEVVHVSSRNSPQGPAIDYMVCLLSDIFVPTYDGPGNLANHLIGQRLYYGFRTTLQPDREALSPLFRDFEKGRTGPSEFQNSVRQIMSQKRQGRLRTRVLPESFFTNPWPECFCKGTAEDDIHKCPSVTVDLVLTDELEGAAVTADKTPEYMAITDKNASD